MDRWCICNDINVRVNFKAVEHMRKMYIQLMTQTTVFFLVDYL